MKYDINYCDYQKEFTEPKFWDKLKSAASSAGKTVVKNALILYYLMLDPNVPFQYKAMIMGALGYFILPVDLVPDFIPVAGYADDAAVLVALIKLLHDNITPEIKAKAQAKADELFK